MMNTRILAGLLLLAATPALAQQGVTASTNGYTAAQRSAAEAALRAAGFTPGAISYVQGGAIFIKGEKGGESFLITVTQDGKVHPGNAIKPTPAFGPAAAAR